MISIQKNLSIEIEITDSSRALAEKGCLIQVASRLPLIDQMVGRKIEEMIRKEIEQRFSAEEIQKQIYRALDDQGISAEVRVSPE